MKYAYEIDFVLGERPSAFLNTKTSEGRLLFCKTTSLIGSVTEQAKKRELSLFTYIENGKIKARFGIVYHKTKA
jgi:hypothetical protein